MVVVAGWRDAAAIAEFERCADEISATYRVARSQERDLLFVPAKARSADENRLE